MDQNLAVILKQLHYGKISFAVLDIAQVLLRKGDRVNVENKKVSVSFRHYKIDSKMCTRDDIKKWEELFKAFGAV